MTADQPTSAPMGTGVERRDSPGLIAPRGHYPHVAVHGGVAHISGQLPLDVAGTPLADRPFDVQVQQVLSNLDDCLNTVGSSRQQLLSVTVYVTDIAQWPAFDAAYAQWLGAPTGPPRCCLRRRPPLRRRDGDPGRCRRRHKRVSGGADITVLGTGGTIDMRPAIQLGAFVGLRPAEVVGLWA